MATFVQLRTRCATRFRDPSNIVVSDSEWGSYINEAYRQVNSDQALWPWKEGQTTLSYPAYTGSTSGASQPLPADVWEVMAVWDQTNQMPIIPLEGRGQYLNEYPQQTEVGFAMHYRVFNNNLFLYPQPESPVTVRIDYRSVIADLVNDSDVPVFPAQYHSMLVEWALAHAYLDDGNDDQYNAHSAVFNDRLDQMRRALLGEPHQDRYYEIVDTFL